MLPRVGELLSEAYCFNFALVRRSVPISSSEIICTE